MAFVFINPVTMNMYDKDSLSAFLESKGFEQVFCCGDWISAVKDKYRKVLDLNPCATIVDMRCPAAAGLVRKTAAAADLVFPDIEPILIHCAEELADSYSQKDSVVITTPCRQLADYGNSRNLPDTTFISWNDFAEKYDCLLKKTHLEKSPVPPGFFHDVEKNVLSLTGRKNIEEAAENGSFGDARLVEMLYCPDGCNNGDGVL